jgi:hypothetical protein
LLALLIPWGACPAADARSALESYLARIAGTSIQRLAVEQSFTLYHPDGRHPAVVGSQRVFLKPPRLQRLEQTVDGKREVRVTVGARLWVRRHDGRTSEAPPAEGRRDRVHLLTAFQRTTTDLLAEWRSFGVRDDVTDEVRVGGRLLTIVGARAGERDRPAVWIDPEYGIVRFITRDQLPQGPAFVDVVFSDHRRLVDHVFYPFRQEVFADGKLLVLVAVRSVTPNPSLSDELFDPEALKRE